MFIRHCFNKAYATMPQLPADVQAVVDDFADNVRYLDADPDIPPVWEDASEEKASLIVERFVRLVRDYVANAEVDSGSDAINAIISLASSTLRNCLNLQLPNALSSVVKSALSTIENLKKL